GAGAAGGARARRRGRLRARRREHRLRGRSGQPVHRHRARLEPVQDPADSARRELEAGPPRLEPLRLLARRLGPLHARPDRGHRSGQLPGGLPAAPAEPRTAAAPAPPRAPAPLAVRAGGGAGVAAVSGAALLLALRFAGPWLSERYIGQAVGVWTTNSARAFDDLDSASSLDPLSARPKLFAGSIALRLGRIAAAERYFRQALERDPRDAYSRLELRALAVHSGRPAGGGAILASARRLEPRDAIARRALRLALRGQRIDIAAINQEIAAHARRLGR